MTIEQIIEIAQRAKVNPQWLTEDEIRALALYVWQQSREWVVVAS